MDRKDIVLIMTTYQTLLLPKCVNPRNKLCWRWCLTLVRTVGTTVVVVLMRAWWKKIRNFIFAIEIACEELQRQAEILPWTKNWSGREGKVQESPVQRQEVKFYSQMRIFREMGQKNKRRGLRTGMLRTPHSSGEEDTQPSIQQQ